MDLAFGICFCNKGWFHLWKRLWLQRLRDASAHYDNADWWMRDILWWSVLQKLMLVTNTFIKLSLHNFASSSNLLWFYVDVMNIHLPFVHNIVVITKSKGQILLVAYQALFTHGTFLETQLRPHDRRQHHWNGVVGMPGWLVALYHCQISTQKAPNCTVFTICESEARYREGVLTSWF